MEHGDMVNKIIAPMTTSGCLLYEPPLSKIGNEPMKRC